jgi:hypothetical protein
MCAEVSRNRTQTGKVELVCASVLDGICEDRIKMGILQLYTEVFSVQQACVRVISMLSSIKAYDLLSSNELLQRVIVCNCCVHVL